MVFKTTHTFLDDDSYTLQVLLLVGSVAIVGVWVMVPIFRIRGVASPNYIGGGGGQAFGKFPGGTVTSAPSPAHGGGGGVSDRDVPPSAPRRSLKIQWNFHTEFVQVCEYL